MKSNLHFVANLCLFLFLLTNCTLQSTTQAVANQNAKSGRQTGIVREIPITSELGPAIGVFLRHFEVLHPRNTKLSVFERIYTNGVMDKLHSSIQVHASTMPISQQYVDLGFLDPDTLTGSETRRMKVFGAVGPFWIHVPTELSKGGWIQAYPTDKLAVGQEHLLFEMAVGLPPSLSSLVLVGEGQEKATMRVTIHVRLDPLSSEENECLRKYHAYNAAFKLER
jgi:hypothetical protein